MTLRYSGICWTHREVALKAKPDSLLRASAKGTVPVLILESGRVIDESLDIMRWALAQHDPDGWEAAFDRLPVASQQLLSQLEDRFKPALDGFKYNNRGPAATWQPFRNQCEAYLAQLDSAISSNGGFSAHAPGFADVALFPFIRQCANVDPGWFADLPLPGVQGWLWTLLEQPLFTSVMQKEPLWMDP